eukprot:175328_1
MLLQLNGSLKPPRDITGITIKDINKELKNLTKDDVYEIISNCFVYNTRSRKVVGQILLIDWNKDRVRKQQGVINEQYIYVTQLHNSAKNRGHFLKYLNVFKVDKWNKLAEIFINEIGLRQEGKIQFKLDLSLHFERLGTTFLSAEINVMLSYVKNRLSTHNLVTKLFRERGNMAWPFTDEQCERISYIFGQDIKSIKQKHLKFADVGENVYITLPVESATNTKRKGQGKRKNQLLNETSKTIYMTIILHSKKITQEQRKRTQELLEQQRIQKQIAYKKSGKPLSDLGKLFNSSQQSEPHYLSHYDEKHKYSDDDVVTLKLKRDHRLYWIVMKLQFAEQYAIKKSNMNKAAVMFASTLQASIGETESEGDCALQMVLMKGNGRLPSGQECQLLRCDIVDNMLSNKLEFDFYKLMLREYYPQITDVVDLIKQWRKPNNQLLMVHVQIAAKLAGVNLVLTTIEDEVKYSTYYQIDKNQDDIFGLYFGVYSHFKRLLFSDNVSKPQIRSYVIMLL